VTDWNGPPPLAPVDDPAAMAGWLGMPPFAEWVQVSSRGAATPVYSAILGGSGIRVRFEHAGGAFERLIPSRSFAGWSAYHLQLFGGTADAVPPAPIRPYLTLPTLTMGDNLLQLREHILEIWYARLFIPEQIAQSESIWSPKQGFRNVITAAGPAWQGKPLAAAGHALALIQAFERHPGGRPEGSFGYESDDDYARAIHKHVYDVPDRLRHLERAKPETIAGWLGISVSSMDRYRSRFGIGVRDIRRRRVPRPN
jgi:hypothetical protein